MKISCITLLIHTIDTWYGMHYSLVQHVFAPCFDLNLRVYDALIFDFYEVVSIKKWIFFLYTKRENLNQLQVVPNFYLRLRSWNWTNGGRVPKVFKMCPLATVKWKTLVIFYTSTLWSFHDSCTLYLCSKNN